MDMFKCLLAYRGPSQCNLYRVRQKKWPPKVFRCFLSNRLEFEFEILFVYLLKPSTFKCQVKFDSVEKRRSYRLFNMAAYRFFSIHKCSGYNTNLITSLKQHS